VLIVICTIHQYSIQFGTVLFCSSIFMLTAKGHYINESILILLKHFSFLGNDKHIMAVFIVILSLSNSCSSF